MNSDFTGHIEIFFGNGRGTLTRTLQAGEDFANTTSIDQRGKQKADSVQQRHN